MRISIRKLAAIVGLAGLLLLAIFALEVWHLKNSYSTLERLQDETEELEKTAEQDTVNARVVKEHEELIKILNSSFVTEGTVVDLLSILKVAGVSSGVGLVISELFEQESGDQELLVVSTEATGSWSEIRSFVTTLEQLPYVYKVNEINLYPEEVEGVSRWRGEFSLQFAHGDNVLFNE